MERDDIIAYTILESSQDGSAGLTVELRTFEEDNQFNATLNAGETVAFSVEELPDWIGGNSSDLLLMSGATNGGWFSLEYSAPYAMEPSFGDGPGLLAPLVAVGDDSYWNDFETQAASNGFSVDNAATTFTMTYSNASILANVTWTKADGLMSHFRYEGTDDGAPVSLELAKGDWDLIPSQANSIDFSTTTALLDYEVTEAGMPGLDNAFNFSAISIEGGDDGPQEAYGMWYVGDRVSVNINDYRSIEEQAGYWAEFHNDHGLISFNISIDLPQENPERNNMFLYPQFLVADEAIIEGYLGVTEVMSEYYSTQSNATHFSITMDHPNGTLSATWERSTGFLTSWMLDNYEEGQLLALDLIAGERIEDLGPNFDNVIADDGNTYQFIQVDIEGENQLSLEEDQQTDGMGYIAEGDLVYVNPIGSDLNIDDSPPVAYYDIIATHGYQNNVSMAFQYPGFDQVEANGPPLLYFHHLQGTEDFYNWMEALYDATGGSYDRNGTHIVMSYSDANATFEQVFRTADNVMLSYYYANIEQDVVLEIVHVSDDNTVVVDSDISSTVSSILSDTNSTDALDTPDDLSLPIFDGATVLGITAFLVAVPALRRRYA